MKRGSIIQIPILIGLLIVLAFLYVFSLERPEYCGGGSVIWNKQKPPKNAAYIEKLLLEDHLRDDGEKRPYKRIHAYWNIENGQVKLCEKIDGGEVSWLISSENVPAVILEQHIAIDGF